MAAECGELVAVRRGAALSGCCYCLLVMVGARGLVLRLVALANVVSLLASSCLVAYASHSLLSSMVPPVKVRPAVCGLLALFSSVRGVVTQV